MYAVETKSISKPSAKDKTSVVQTHQLVTPTIVLVAGIIIAFGNLMDRQRSSGQMDANGVGDISELDDLSEELWLSLWKPSTLASNKREFSGHSMSGHLHNLRTHEHKLSAKRCDMILMHVDNYGQKFYREDFEILDRGNSINVGEFLGK